MSNFEGKSLHVVEKEDLDYITGGAKVSKNVSPGCKETFRTKAHCADFKRRKQWMCLDICDNCKYAVAKDDSSSTIYCTKGHN